MAAPLAGASVTGVSSFFRDFLGPLPVSVALKSILPITLMPGMASALPSTTVEVATGASGARGAIGVSFSEEATAGDSMAGSGVGSALGADVLVVVLAAVLGAGAATAWLMPLINTSF